MKPLLFIAVIAIAASSIAVNAAKTSPVDMSQVAKTMAGVHAVDVVDGATKRRRSAAGL